jgi:segregation and condensation protein A
LAEKTIPWWRKAFNYALEGIRTGFGLFSRQAKPQPAKESELSNPIEENPEEESLTQPSTNPEAVTAEPAKLAEPLNAVEHEVAAIPVPKPVAAVVPALETEAFQISQAPQPFIYQSAEQLDAPPTPSDRDPEAQLDEPDTKAPSAAPEPENELVKDGEATPQDPSSVTGHSSPQDPSPVSGHDFSRADEANQTEGALAPAGFPPEAVPVSLTSEATVETPIQEPEDPAAPGPAIDPDPESDPEPDPEPEAPPAIDPGPATPPVREPDPDPETAPPVKASTATLPQLDVLPLGEDVQSAAEDEVPIGNAPTTNSPAAPASDAPEAEPQIAEVIVVLTAVSEAPGAEIEAAEAIVPLAEPEPQPTLETAPESVKTVAPPEPEPVVATIASREPAAEPVAEAEPTPAPEIATAPPFAAAQEEIKAAPEPTPVQPLAQVETAEAEPAPDLVLTNKPPVKVESRDNAADLSPFSVIVDQVYDGPLDLLLDLIRKQDIDIYDIPIAKITAQFLAYVNQLKATDVDVAGEFIYIASLLIHIKSKMLLPRAETGPDDAAEDPRRELVERLLEHERFKNAAQMLQQKQMLEAATWTNPGVREFKDDASVEPEIAADTVDLVRVFRDIIERARKRPVFNVDEDAVTVGQMIQFLARRLTMEDKPIALRRLLSHTRSERALIAMFLALLELVRLQAILLRQDLAFSEIFIKKHTGFDAVINEGLANAHDDWR